MNTLGTSGWLVKEVAYGAAGGGLLYVASSRLPVSPYVTAGVGSAVLSYVSIPESQRGPVTSAAIVPVAAASLFGAVIYGTTTYLTESELAGFIAAGVANKFIGVFVMILSGVYFNKIITTAPV